MPQKNFFKSFISMNNNGFYENVNGDIINIRSEFVKNEPNQSSIVKTDDINNVQCEFKSSDLN
jgi:hypothetical protein